tara:strand:- start:149 stop:715 length:567 start_codon:yes stop_codon:yes gene_type:complete
MNKLNVVIFNIPALYEILLEFKSELNFNLFDFKEKNEKFNLFLKNNPNSLIISPDEKIKFKNHIVYKKAIKIKSLLQQINIYLSKSNFEIKSNVLIGKYKIDINSRIISVENLSLKLTEKEIDLLIYLKNSTKESNSSDLQKNVWYHSKDLETHTVETHIYRLRKKLFEKFGDNEFITNNKKGYKILK